MRKLLWKLIDLMQPEFDCSLPGWSRSKNFINKSLSRASFAILIPDEQEERCKNWKVVMTRCERVPIANIPNIWITAAAKSAGKFASCRHVRHQVSISRSWLASLTLLWVYCMVIAASSDNHQLPLLICWLGGVFSKELAGPSSTICFLPEYIVSHVLNTWNNFNLEFANIIPLLHEDKKNRFVLTLNVLDNE